MIRKGVSIENNSIFFLFFKFISIEIGEYLASDAYKDQKPWTTIDDRIREGKFLAEQSG